MCPSLSSLDAVFEERQKPQVKYLSDLHDTGPEDPELSEYIDADVLNEICKNCRRRRPARARRVRAYRRL